MALFEILGFEGHPFAKTNADEEEFLASYFVPPPFFEAVVGDPRTPNASVVFAPRGGGKTAQRKMVEKAAFEKGFLAVTYDRFEFGAGQTVATVSLQYHLRNLITRLLVSYLSYLNDYPDLLRMLDKDDKQRISLFVHTYLGSLHGDSLQHLLQELRSLPERFRDFWRNNVGFLESLVNILLKKYGLEAIDLPDLKQEEKKLAETYKHQLQWLHSKVAGLGFQSVYVLLDKPDETEKTGNDPEATYTLIRPLLRDLELLGLPGYAFKFFLWDQVEPFYRGDARPDRVHQYHLRWSRQQLQDVLSKRLAAFSVGRITKLADIAESNLGYDVDQAVCILANSSPRNTIRICEKIYSAQGQLDAAAHKISAAAIDQGVLDYCDQVAKEQYSQDAGREVQRIGRCLFTINYLANEIFRVQQNAIRNRITNWSRTGMVRQIGTTDADAIRRPHNLYAIVDPAVVRLVHRASGLKDFIGNHWVPCRSCGYDNLADISALPAGDDLPCVECGRSLF